MLCVRNFILFLGLLGLSVNSFADWQTKAVHDPFGELSQFSLRASENFPIFTLSCIDTDASPVDLLQIDRLTLVPMNSIERIEFQVDSNPGMIFFPDQHRINVAYQYHWKIKSGIETVTLMPANDSGEIQFAELVRQFIRGRRATARVVSYISEREVSFSLIGFTQAQSNMQTACVDNENT